MKELKTPYAKNAVDQVVHASEATKGESYLCLQCNEQLTLRRSRRERAHFAHLPQSTCAGQTFEHLAAVRKIANLYLTAINDRAAQPAYRRACDVCCLHNIPYKFDSPYDSVMVEFVCGDRRPDVALLQNGKVVAMVEVHKTNEVDTNRWVDLSSKAPWVEVAADDVLTKEPPWNAKQVGTPREIEADFTACDPCSLGIDDLSYAIDTVSLTLQMPAYNLPGHVACGPYRCFHCRKVTLVYIWDRRINWETAVERHYNSSYRKRVRHPRVIVNTQAGAESRNACGHCGKLLPEMFLSGDVASPFHHAQRIIEMEFYGEHELSHLGSLLASITLFNSTTIERQFPELMPRERVDETP